MHCAGPRHLAAEATESEEDELKDEIDEEEEKVKESKKKKKPAVETPEEEEDEENGDEDNIPLSKAVGKIDVQLLLHHRAHANAAVIVLSVYKSYDESHQR